MNECCACEYRIVITPIPEHSEGTLIGEYLLNEDYEFRMSTLQYDRSTESFYLYAQMRRTENDEQSTALVCASSTDSTRSSIH
ncbi:hypothetical protein SAMN04487948_11419 [Halogranum amylolyticum]|uniref:Uncharacterized protein n=1 Tax=Halogranum amylolyticum TaxID=660520 RepID=A0A1H8V4F4_9EURY|nr:hypothetical protein SAMN04487948_11419 [Halogranum amylolyticum]